MCGCGDNFQDLRIPLEAMLDKQAAPAAVIRNDAPQMVCPHCKTLTLPEYIWCPQCGIALKSYSCAYCGNSLTPEEFACPSCGAPAKRS